MTRRLLIASASALLLSGPAQAEDKVVNVYNWSDYIGATVNDDFTAKTGIAVQYDVFDSAETVSTKMLTGSSGYDVVVTSGGFLVEQIQAGVFLKLDKGKLPNIANLDPDVMRAAAAFDPGNQYSVPYFWGTTGIGYNIDKIEERAPDAPVDSLAMVLDPKWAAKFQDCGIAILDADDQIMAITLNYLGLDPHSENADDYAKAAEMLKAIRPYVRYFHSSQYISDITNGEICLSIGWSGDLFIAEARAAEAGGNVRIGYSIPKEGTMVWIDNLAIPADAPHPENALAYINYLLDGRVAAQNAAELHVASPNKAALQTGSVPAEDLGNPGIYPPDAVKAKLFGETKTSPEIKRVRSRLWTSVKTGE
jgi:putrescine transport system substrate-binding protein